MIRILIVEDSVVLQEFLKFILGSDPELEIAGTAANGEEALAAVQKIRPDIITMDINMPKMNGLEATRRIMETLPTPIVIVSGNVDSLEIGNSFDAVEAGALAVLSRPKGLGHPEFEVTANELVRTVKAMAEIKVIRRWPRERFAKKTRDNQRVELGRHARGIKIVAIGASAGGPVILQRILSKLPGDFPLPILIVQHISPGFIAGFADWLGQATGFSIKVAQSGTKLLSGQAYLAPDARNMKVTANDKVVLHNADPNNGICPSVSALFHSVAEIYGPNAAGVLLTGMGRDGADGLKRMAEKGAITIVQDKESSLVYGMPAEALKLKAADYVLSPEEIAAVLTKFCVSR